MSVFEVESKIISKYYATGLYDIRKKHGLSVRDMAMRLDISSTYVSMLESKQRSVTKDMANYILGRLYKHKLIDDLSSC